MNKFLLLIALTFLSFNISCKKNPTSSDNAAPIASFTVNPNSGTTATTFTFDASGSTDNEDDTALLEVRWDWESDGTYDTNYSTTKTTTHQYSTVGICTVKLEVKDSGGLAHSTTKTVTIYTGTVTDIDGNVYQTVQIGNQLWMAENLKVTHYRNGEAIPNVTSATEWPNLSTGAYCSYDNDDGNISIYGLLYNWYAVDDTREFAPAGWHIPTDDEWKALEIFLGMSQSEANDYGTRGSYEGSKLKSTSGWYNNGNGTNESGFSALPGGYRSYYDGTVLSMGGGAGFWSSSETEYDSSFVWYRGLSYGSSAVTRYNYPKRSGLSVRCIRD